MYIVYIVLNAKLLENLLLLTIFPMSLFLLVRFYPEEVKKKVQQTGVFHLSVKEKRKTLLEMSGNIIRKSRT